MRLLAFLLNAGGAAVSVGLYLDSLRPFNAACAVFLGLMALFVMREDF